MEYSYQRDPVGLVAQELEDAGVIYRSETRESTRTTPSAPLDLETGREVQDKETDEKHQLSDLVEPTSSHSSEHTHRHSSDNEGNHRHGDEPPPTHIVDNHDMLSTHSSSDTFSDIPPLYPEGGRKAWTVVFGSFCGLVVSLGIMNTIGSVNSYISETYLKNDSEQKIGWIFGIYAFLSFFLGVQIGPLFDRYGSRLLNIFGACLIVLGTFTTAESTNYWQFMLSFGICTGIGCSVLIVVGPSCVSHYFNEKRGLASGIAICGGAVGGVVFPIVMKVCITAYGFPWAMRILGFVYLGLLIVAIILCDSRGPEIVDIEEKLELAANPGVTPSVRTAKKPAAVDLTAFKDMRFTLLVISVFAMELSLFVPLTYLGKYGIEQEIGGKGEDSFGWWIFAISNAGSAAGRLVTGWTGDKWGRFNTMLASISSTALFIFAVWLPTSNKFAVYIVFAVLWGFTSGSFISLTPVCIGQISDTKSFGTRYGTCYMVASLGSLIGPPVAGAVYGTASWTGLICFTRGMTIFSFLFLTASRLKCAPVWARF